MSLNIKKSLLVFLVGLLLTLLAVRVNAAKETAPGQLKKQENAVQNNPQTEQANQGQGQGQGNKQGQLQILRSGKPEIKPGPGNVGSNKMQGLIKQGKLEKVQEKIGSAKLKDILSQLSTGSAEAVKQKNKNLKIAKVRVAAASESAQLKRHAIQGLISALGDGVITLVHQIQRDRAYQVFYNEATIFKMKGAESTSSAILAVGQRIAAVGEPVEGGLMARRIHIIPGKASGIFNRLPLATPSGEITLTPTATVSATPTITPVSSPSATLTPTTVPPSVTPTPT